MIKSIVAPILLLFILSTTVFCKTNPALAVDNIPLHYRTGIKAVVQETVLEVEITGPDKIIENHKEIITVFDESAFHLAIFVGMYHDLSKISSIDIEVYDAKGERVRKARSRDIEDYSAIPGNTVFNENRVKYYEPNYKDYPFTIVRSFKRKYKSAYYLPSWTPYQGSAIPVMNAELIVKAPQEYNLRYLEQNMPEVRDEQHTSDEKTYKWSYSNYIPKRTEPYSPSLNQTLPFVFLAPGKFEMEGEAGDLSSWKTFGAFLSKLNEDRQSLPDETADKIQQLIASAEDDYEKTKRIYEYMQQQTRYVNIQMGIGGLQPFEAERVNELAYGDCKALSNYTRALLQIAGIESKYCVVRAGRNAAPIHPEFASHQFNHAILAVPLQTDTVWLECTSQHHPCGYLGSFTDDRLVLMVDNGQGRLVKTPKTALQENAKLSNGQIHLDQTGDAAVSCKITYKGDFFDSHSSLTVLNKEDQRKEIVNDLNIPGLQLNNYTLSKQKSREPKLQNELNFNVSKYSTKMGNRILVPLNVLNKFSGSPRELEKRTQPVVVKRGKVYNDTWQINIPAGYADEAIPENITLESPYGHFETSLQKKDDGFLFTRKFVLNEGQYPPKEYDAFKSFLESVEKADQKKLVLRKK